MTTLIQAVRGMSDIVPANTPFWQLVEGTARDVLHAYGYQEIRLPVMERTELFSRSIGEVTDIVEKEMYTFTDRSGDSLTLRPEGTASCVRAGIERGLFRSGVQRWWYMGPMFRHERPQKGRFRQFHQIGAEAFGIAGVEIDAEMILMTSRLWRRLGLHDLRLELNSLGSASDRATYRAQLVSHFSEHMARLDDDSRRRLDSNPLRILDSKNPDMKAVIETAPRLLDYLAPDSKMHFEQLCGILESAQVPYVLNPRLVRGLDYYTHTVFEWVTDALGAQGTVCAGGRYDDLVSQFGGPATPAVGYAIGLERVIELIQGSNVELPNNALHAYFIAVGKEAALDAPRMAESLRDSLPGLRLIVDAGEGSLKGKLRRADRSGARLALILGENEHRSGQISVKNLRESVQQVSLDQAALSDYLENAMSRADA